MDDVKILVSTTNNLNILFVNPKIESKTMLKFEKNTCNTESYYDLSNKKILMKIGSVTTPSYINLNIPKDTIDILDNIHKEAYAKIELFFNSLNSGICELLISEDKKTIYTKELIDNFYSPYYCKLFTYFINSKFKQTFKDIESVQSFLLNKINYENRDLKEIEEYGKFYIVQIKDIK